MTASAPEYCSHCVHVIDGDPARTEKKSARRFDSKTYQWYTHEWTEKFCQFCAEHFIHDRFFGDDPACDGNCVAFGIRARTNAA